MNQTSNPVIAQWVKDSRATIQAYDHAGHMDLISRQMQVFGVPGFEVIDYASWYAHSEHEFNTRHILDAQYDNITLRHEGASQIVFVTAETIIAADHSSMRHAVEVELTKEADNVWRVTRQRLLNQHEATHFGIVV